MKAKCLLISIVVLLILSLPFVAEAIKDNALVLYLPFDEGKGKTTKDLSGKDNNGVLDGDVEWVKNGKVGSAVSFSEKAQQGVVAVKASESLAITQSLTMEVWAYPRTVGDYRNLRGQANPHTYYLSIHQSKPSVWLSASNAWLSSAKSIPVDDWTHIAAVYDFNKGELRIYINGELDAKHTVNGEIVGNMSGDHWFGNRLDGAWPYGGFLDEFAIYNRALTADEIQMDMRTVLSVAPLEKLAATWAAVKVYGNDSCEKEIFDSKL